MGVPRRVPATEPTGPLNSAGHLAIVATLRVALRVLFHLRLADVRPLPPGPLIIAPNHRSFLDPAVLGAVLDRRITYIMTAKYYDLPVLGRIFRLERCIVVEHVSDNRSALRQAKQVLEAEGVVCIFPEGHISPDGHMQPGQLGVAWLAARTGAPVIPLHLGGTREALPRGRWWPCLSRITARTGEAMTMDGYAPGRDGQRAFTEDLMRAIAALDLRARDPQTASAGG